MGRMKTHLMNISYAIGCDGDLDTPKMEVAWTMIQAEHALWELLDHLDESSVPASVWNETVSAIDDLRFALREMGAGNYHVQLANFRPISHEDTDDDGDYSPGFRRHATSGARSKPGIDSVGTAETP